MVDLDSACDQSTSPWSRPSGASVWSHSCKSTQIFALAEVYVTTGAETRTKAPKEASCSERELGTIIEKLGLRESGLEQLPMPILAGAPLL